MMLRTRRLTAQELRTFEEDGFLHVRGAFDEREVARIDAWCRELAERPEESGKHWVYHEKSRLNPEESLINRIEYMSPFHEGFRELADVLKTPAGQLLGEEAVLFKEKVNFKMPGGDGFKPHQDSQAGWDEYADYFVNVLVGIDEATVENGCLQIVAGRHEHQLFEKWRPLTENDMVGMVFTPVPTAPGDLLFFDCYAPHASEPNHSDRIRRLYYATYNRRSAGDHMRRYYADKHRNFPPDVDRDPEREYVYRV